MEACHTCKSRSSLYLFPHISELLPQIGVYIPLQLYREQQGTWPSDITMTPFTFCTFSINLIDYAAKCYTSVLAHSGGENGTPDNLTNMSSVLQHGLVQYNIDTNNFTDYGGDYLWFNLGNLYGESGGGSFYTQINETMLFTIRSTGDYIHAYDLQSLSYQALPSEIPINVSNGACLASSESPAPQIFVVGGPAYAPQGWLDPLYTLQILDLSVGNWSIGPNMAFGRVWHGCVVVNDWLWAIGWSMAMEAIYVPELSNSSSDSTWDIMGYMPIEFLSLHCIAVFEDMIFVVGGCHGDVSSLVCPSDTVWIVDTNDRNGDIETLKLPYAVAEMSVVVIDRTIYGFGGFGESQNDSQSLPPLDSWWKYEMLSTASNSLHCTPCLSTGTQNSIFKSD